MKKCFFVLFISFILLTLTGCMKTYRYDDDNFWGEIKDFEEGLQERKEEIESVRKFLVEMGLAGNIDLMDLTREKGFEGKFRGGFLSGTSGEIKSYSSVVFRWKMPDGRGFISELPLNKVILQDTKGSPKIRFVFHISNTDYRYLWWSEESHLALIRRNPNHLVNQDFVFLATIEISEEDIVKYLKFK